jgi:hypothetical protein
MFIDRWFFVVYLGYFALILLLLFKLLFWILILERDIDAILWTGLGITYPKRCNVVFISFVYFMTSYNLQDLCDSIKII